MEFEFDPVKSETNLQKHQINFVDAQQLWTDQFAAVADARSESEPRFTLIAQWQGRIWTAFFTLRNDKIRLISVRRARQNEEILYHEGRTTR
jgi:uncharacterized DUF497 family protein